MYLGGFFCKNTNGCLCYVPDDDRIVSHDAFDAVTRVQWCNKPLFGYLITGYKFSDKAALQFVQLLKVFFTGIFRANLLHKQGHEQRGKDHFMVVNKNRAKKKSN